MDMAVILLTAISMFLAWNFFKGLVTVMGLAAIGAATYFVAVDFDRFINIVVSAVHMFTS